MTEHRLITSLMRPFFKKGPSTSFTVPGFLGNESSILCLDNGVLTDVLFHVALIRALRRRYPAAKIDFLLPEEHAQLIVPSGMARHCIIYKDNHLNPWRPSFSSLLRKLGEGGYDMTMIMAFAPEPRLELAAMATGAALRLGPSHASAWPAVNFEMKTQADDESYLGDRLVRTAPFLGLSPEEMALPWPLPVDQVRQVAQQVHFHKPNPDQMLIGVDPTAGKSGRALALENLLFLVRQLNSQLVCKVLPLGDPIQKSRLEKFETRLSEVPIGLSRETLFEMVMLLSQCDLFLAANTDFFHLAVSLGVPTIGLFTAADGAHWIPKNRDSVRVLSVAKGEKVDIETLMEAVEAVTGGQTSRPSTVISEDENAADQPPVSSAEPKSDSPDAEADRRGPAGAPGSDGDHD